MTHPILSSWVARPLVASSCLLTLAAGGLWARADDSHAAARAPAPATPAAPATSGASGAVPVPPDGSEAAQSSVVLEPLVTDQDGGVPSLGSLPDPKPLVARERWTFDLLFQEGEMVLRSVHKEVLDRAIPIDRKMGRFVLELYVGPELLERVRFDFPLLGAGDYERKRRWNSPPNFERHARTSMSVSVPNNDRATQLILFDRASRQAWKMPWPPSVARSATTSRSADAGSAAANRAIPAAARR